LVAACSSDKASPQNSFSELTGKTTTLTLSAKFVADINRLGVTPTPIGHAKVSLPTVTFPITGGNLDIYKEGDATPQIQGEVDHNHSGLQLTVGKGKTKKAIQLKNFTIDSGTAVKADVLINGKPFARQGALFDLDQSAIAPPEVTDSAATISGIKVNLSDDAAAALNTAFGKNTVKGGLLIGTATIDATGKS
jgi:hypothetical protein